MLTIIGEAPSQHSNPEYPFEGASGDRLAKLLGYDRVQSLRESVKLLNVLQKWPGSGYRGEKGSGFPVAKARRAAKKIPLHGVVVFAGRRVARAFGCAPDAPYYRWRIWSSKEPFAVVAIMPHPSGCNRYWNYPSNHRKALAFLNAAEEFSDSMEIRHYA